MTTKLSVRVARTGFAALLLAGVSSVAMAQTPDAPPPGAADARIAQLEAEVQQLADEVQDLKRGQAEQIQTIATVEKSVPAAPSAIVSIGNGKPTIATADGKFSATLHGIMQLDTADYNQRSPGPTTTDFRRDGPAIGASATNVDAAHARDLKNGDVFRRARVGIDGVAFGDWDYRFIFDFGGSGVENAGQVYETWVQYSGLKPFHFRVGAFSPSIGLDDQASTNGMPFLERAVSSDIARGLAAGDTRTAAEIWASSDHWLVSGAVTGRTIGVVNTGTIPGTLNATTGGIGTAQTYGDQLGFVGRVAGTPFYGKDWLVHFGIHGSYVDKPADTAGPAITGVTPAGVVAFSNTPELRVDGTKLINTGNIPARSAYTVGAEFAAQKQNFLLQAEYDDFGVDRSDGQANPNFHGYYVSGTWVITGEARKYNTQTGAFDAPPVAHPFSLSKGGWGAWELGVRYSDMDLNYHQGAAGTYVPTTANSIIRGGDEQNITAGLNWYLNPVVRFMFDYSHVKIDRLSPGTNGVSNNNNTLWLLPSGHYGQQIGQTYDVFAVRSQVAF
jgi:phosphate-selective porin OprO/OprP